MGAGRARGPRPRRCDRRARRVGAWLLPVPTGRIILPMSEPAQTPERRRTRRETARTAGLVLLAVLMTLFAVLNVKEVEVNWIFGKSETPLIIVILVSLLVGIVLTHFAEVRSRRKR